MATNTNDKSQTDKNIEALSSHESNSFSKAYDFLPVGYFILSTKGLILELNLAGAKLLGKERSKLKNKPFGAFISKASKPTFNQFFKKVLKSNKKLVCDLTLKGLNDSTLYIQVESVASENKGEIHQTAIDITKRKQVQNELSESRDLLQSIIESIPTRVFWKDTELRYMGANTALAKDAGMSSPEEMLGKDDFQMGWSEQAELYRADDQYVMDTGKPRIAYEEPQTTPDGQTIWLRTSKVPLRDANRKVIGILGIYDDITEQKKAEEAIIKIKNELKSALESMSDAVFISDVHGNFVNYNEAFISFHRLKDKEERFEALKDWTKIIEVYNLDGSVLPLDKWVVNRAIKGETVSGEEYILENKGTGERWYGNYNYAPIRDDKGMIIGSVVVARDVTDRVQSEKDLQESEEKYRSIFENSALGIFRSTSKGRYEEVNKAFAKILGFNSPKNIVNEVKDISALYKSPKDREKIINEFAEKGFVEDYVVLANHPHKEQVWISINAKQQKYPDGTVYYEGTIKDITERKKAEEALHASEEMMRNSQSVAHICSYSTNLNVNKIGKSEWVCSPEFYNIFGIDETYPHTIEGWVNFIHQDYRQEVFDYHESVVKEKKSFNREYKIVRINDGAERWVHGTGELEFDEKGNPVRMHGAIQDITLQKKAEEELIQSEKRLKTILDTSPFPTALADLKDENIQYWSKSAVKLFGHKPKRIREWYELAYPDPEYRKEVVARWNPFLEKSQDSEEAINTGEYQITCKDGSVKTCEIFAQYIPGNLIVTFNDITERKQAENEVLKISQHHQALIEKAPDGIVLLNSEGSFKYISPSAKRMFGYLPTDEVHRNHAELTHPDDLQTVLSELGKVFKDPNYVPTLEYRFADKQGHWHWVETTFSNLLANPSVEAIVLNFREITERKQNEEELIESEERYRNLLNNVSAGIGYYDLEGNVILFNKLAASNMNGKPEDFIGKSIFEIYGKELGKFYFDRIQSAAEAISFLEFEDEVTLPKRKMWFVSRYSRIFNADGVVSGVQIVSHDITEKKKAEDLVIKAKEIAVVRDKFFNTVLNNMGDPVFVKDDQSRLLLVNDAFCELFGLQRADIIGKTLAEDVPEEEMEQFLKIDKQVLLDGKENINEETITVRDKQTKVISTRKTRFIDEQGRKFLVGISRDFTDRKRAEEEITRQKKTADNYLNIVGNAILALNGKGEITLLNKRGYEIIGYENGALDGEDWFTTCLPEDIRDEVKAYFSKLLDGKLEPQDEYENEIVRKDGQKIIVKWRNSLIKDELGHITGILSAGEDITAQKQAEKDLMESEIRFKALHNATFGGIAIHDNGLLLDCNHGLSQTTGYSENELIGMDVLQLFAEESREMVKANIVAEYEEAYEAIGMRKNGEKYPVRIAAKMIPYKGEKVRVAEFRDITEQKKAIEKLKKSEELHRLLTENSVDLIWQMDLRLNFTYISPNTIDTLGFTPEEVVGTNLSRYATRKEFFKMARQALNSLKNYKTFRHVIFEANLIKKNGEEIPVEINGRILLNKSGLPVALQGSTRDITERKNAEKVLYQSEIRFRELVQTISSGVSIYSVINDGMSGADYIFQDMNEAALKIEDLPKEKIIGKSLLDLRPNIDEYGLIPIFRKVWKSGQPAHFPAKEYIDGKFKSFYENKVYRIPSGEIVAVYDDVTEREKTAMQIAESNKRFDLAMKATSDGLFDWNLVTNEIYFSPTWKRMLGYRDDELPNDFSIWENLTEPEDAKRSWKMLQEMINKQRDRFEKEFKMKHKDGHWVDILSRAEAIFDENGKAIRVVGTHVDMTERKRQEEKLHESEKKYRDLINLAQEGIWVIDKNNITTFANPSMATMLKYTPEEMIGKSLFYFMDEQGVKFANENLERRKIGLKERHDFEFICKNGDRIFCTLAAAPIMDTFGNYEGSIAGVIDITERNIAEKKIKKLNEELEDKVLERTKSLEDKMMELARMNKLFVGRELRMKELKQIIKELEEKLEDK
ncbi:MAG: PAS domain S-box protein [Bacteroidetes bacterium]|nr:PAS domain S-box protein [Bacteroidota bacterium]